MLPMRVWMLTGAIPGAAGGGIARYTDQMATALAAEGVEVTVFGPATRATERVVEGGYTLVTVCDAMEDFGAGTPSAPEDPPPPVEASLNPELAIAYRLSEAVAERARRTGPPTVIEAPEYKALGVFIKQRQLTDPRFLPGVPLVVMLHTPDFLVRELNREPRHVFPHYWVGVQERFSIESADAVMAPCEAIVDALRARLEGWSAPVEVCPLPLEPPLDDGAMAERAESDLLLYFGRLERRKGVLELLAACEERWESGHRFRLRLIGAAVFDPTLGQSLDDWIPARYGFRIEEGLLELIGELSRDDLAPHLAEATAVVIPSRWENFPYTALETLRAGQLLLASREGGLTEMIGGETGPGFLFSWSEPDSFQRALERLLGLSPEERIARSRAARARVREAFSPRLVASRRVAFFETLRAKKPTRFPLREVGLSPRRARLPEERIGAITVVVPCYNLGAYLEAAIASVRASPMEDLTILVVDDGSTDPVTCALLEEWERAGPPDLRILRKRNGGLARARNDGAQAAATEFVAFLDADDLVRPTFLGRARWILQNYPNVDIVSSWVQFFGQDSGVWKGWNLQFPYLLSHNLMVPICLVRRQAFLAHGQNDPGMEYGLEDLEGWISMLAAGCGGVVIPEPLVLYRVRHRSMFRSINRAAHLYLHDRIVARHPELFREHGPELFRLLNANGPAHDFDQPTAWGAPYEALAQRETERVREQAQEARRWWERSVELEGEVLAARKAAAQEWRTACELRERLAKLDAAYHRLKEASPPTPPPPRS